MISILSPLQVMSVALVGWLNRQQQVVIEYLLEENPVLREQVGQDGFLAPILNAAGWR